jgi:hypothetical protein
MEGMTRYGELNHSINKKLENWKSEYEKILHLTPTTAKNNEE